MSIDPTFAAFPAEVDILRRELFCSPGDYAIEVGCFLGSTTVPLAETCSLLRKTLVCIDPWDGSQDGARDDEHRRFLEAVTPVADSLMVIRAKSADAVLPADLPGNCGLVFVDGDHRYEAVLADLRRFWPLLSPGGVLACHDAFDPGWGPGVMRAVTEFAASLAPVTVEHFVYYPTPDEVRLYHHPASGLTLFRKPRE